MGKPFESLATTELCLLTWKTAFLVAVTSAQRASDLFVFRVNPQTLFFIKNYVVLCPDSSFLPQVVSFHLSQPTILSTFFPNAACNGHWVLNSLDVQRAVFLSQKDSVFCKDPDLFVIYGKPRKSHKFSFQSLAKWVTSTIWLAYELAKSHCLNALEPIPPGLYQLLCPLWQASPFMTSVWLQHGPFH